MDRIRIIATNIFQLSFSLGTYQNKHREATTRAIDLQHNLQNTTRTKKRFERHRAYKMFQELKLVFQTHARVERYETSDKYFAYKMEENSSTSEHVLRMSGYYNHLNQVGVNLPDKIVIDKVL